LALTRGRSRDLALVAAFSMNGAASYALDSALPLVLVGLGLIAGSAADSLRSSTLRSPGRALLVLAVALGALGGLDPLFPLAEHPLSLALRLVAAGEAVLLALGQRRAATILLGALSSLHLAPLAFAEELAVFPLLALGASGLLLVFWLEILREGALMASSREVRIRQRGGDPRAVVVGAATSRRAASALVIGVLAIGLVLFFLVPRIRFELELGDDTVAGVRFRVTSAASTEEEKGLLARRQAAVGYSESVSLDQAGPGALDTARLFTVVCRNPDGTSVSLPRLSLRGSTLDLFDGRTWQRSSRVRQVEDAEDGEDGWITIPRRLSPPGRPILQELRLPRAFTRVVFALPVIHRIAAPALRVDVDDGSVRLLGSPEGEQVITCLSHWQDRETVRGKEMRPTTISRRNLDLPPGSRDLRDLALSMVGDARGLFEKCERIESTLRGFTYSLEADYSDSKSPLSDFLFARREGYCIHFASAMVVLLRSLAIPARLACGFATQERGEAPGEYLVRRKDAHSWVEVHFGESGWISFDPTPLDASAGSAASVGSLLKLDALLRYVSRFGEEERRRLLGGAGPRALLVLLGAVLLGVAFLLRGSGGTRERVRRASRPRTEVRFYGEFLRLLEAKGMRPRPQSTPHEIGVLARRWFPEADVETLTSLFCAVRYADRTLTEDEASLAREVLASLARTQHDGQPAPGPV